MGSWAPMKKHICNYAGIAIFLIPVELYSAAFRLSKFKSVW